MKIFIIVPLDTLLGYKDIQAEVNKEGVNE